MKYIVNFIFLILIFMGGVILVGITALTEKEFRDSLDYESRSIEDKAKIDTGRNKILIYSFLSVLIGFCGLLARIFSLI